MARGQDLGGLADHGTRHNSSNLYGSVQNACRAEAAAE
jgi:hypothetical protein